MVLMILRVGLLIILSF